MQRERRLHRHDGFTVLWSVTHGAIICSLCFAFRPPRTAQLSGVSLREYGSPREGVLQLEIKSNEARRHSPRYPPSPLPTWRTHHRTARTTTLGTQNYADTASTVSQTPTY